MNDTNLNNTRKGKCQHYSECGGCDLQHLSDEEYIKYKSEIARKTLNNLQNPNDNNTATQLKPLEQVGQGHRRRADFKISVYKKDISIGFYKKKSHDVVSLEECLVCAPEIINFVKIFREFLSTLKKPSYFISINISLVNNGHSKKGLDLIFNLRKSLKSGDYNKLESFISEHNNSQQVEILRLSEKINTDNQGNSHSYGHSYEYNKLYINPEEQPAINFDDIDVYLPISAFLQATEKSQNIMSKIISTHLSDCTSIADLYCGCGTFSFPLLQNNSNIKLSGFEGSEQMVNSFFNAARNHDLSERVTVSTRDLYKRPLKDYELNNFDGIVINPPRNGALPQIKSLANTNNTLKKIAMVSCNPETFQRDAKYLLDNSSFTLESITPIDQFYWSHHLEIVGLFTRKP